MADQTRDVGAFADAVSPGPLADWQRDELRAAVGSPLSTWLWGRQLGKSMALALLALWVAFSRRDSLVLIVSGGGEVGARRVVEEVRAIAAADRRLAGSVTDETGLTFHLSTGSTVQGLALSEPAVRGWRAAAVLADEAQALPAWALSALLPTLTAAGPEGFAVLAGTAGRAEGPFYDLCRQGEVGAEHVRFSRRVSRLVGGDDLAPWQSPTSIETQLAALGPTRADAEHRCRWATSSDRLLSLAEVEAVFADYRPDPLDGLSGPAAVFGGLDLAVSRAGDHSAFVGLGRMVRGAEGPPVVGVRCAHLWARGHALMAPDGGPPGVFEELASSPAVLESIRVDSTGMQGGFLSYLWPLLRRRPLELGGGRPRTGFAVVEMTAGGSDVPWRRPAPRGAAKATSMRGVNFMPAVKQAAFGSLRLLVQRQALLFPAAAVELRSQLLNLTVGLSRSGGETFEADAGGFDDLMDALVLALHPYRRADGQWRTVVGDIAAHGGVPVVAPRGLWAPGRVATGGGLEVPAVPVWASMRGPALSVPAELNRPAPEPAHIVAARRRVAEVLSNQQPNEGRP